MWNETCLINRFCLLCPFFSSLAIRLHWGSMSQQLYTLCFLVGIMVNRLTLLFNGRTKCLGQWVKYDCRSGKTYRSTVNLISLDTDLIGKLSHHYFYLPIPNRLRIHAFQNVDLTKKVKFLWPMKNERYMQFNLILLYMYLIWMKLALSSQFICTYYLPIRFYILLQECVMYIITEDRWLML